MGFTYTDVILKNSADVEMAANGLIKESDVRSVAVRSLVDTGATTLILSETVANKLGLTLWYEGWANLAGEYKAPFKSSSPVSIYWGKRIASCTAYVFPGDAQTLLGAVPMELMDLTVNPKTQTVEGVHGDEVVGTVM
jgi:predicted aspartyl protease